MRGARVIGMVGMVDCLGGGVIGCVSFLGMSVGRPDWICVRYPVRVGAGPDVPVRAYPRGGELIIPFRAE